ncbi:MAG: esterase-like activity of phytase family protein [Roseitalea porphyridii]|uniref:esterase-like activity of phytase family protein n=1 Tax=Roseitalea porphyridii TaxID=1852022 RepID=UPI0032D97DDE
MHKFLLTSAAAVALVAGLSVPATAEVFNRIASFPVNENIPGQMGQDSESSSEIIDATDDGMMLVYSDSPLGGIGMVDISDPANPAPGGFVALDGEPTAVVVAGSAAIVGLNTSESYADPSGQLVSVDLASGEITASCDLGGQPDSVALSPDGSFVAVAIENERDEDLNDGVIPQMPAGFAVTYRVGEGLDCDSRVEADLTGLAEVAGDDPEPEFVDINEENEVVVSMQENNHIAIFDGTTGEVVAHFSAGSVDLDNIDTEEEGALTFDGSAEGVVREPDAVKWLDNDRIVTANEGDYEGGSRGFTIFSQDGEVLYESGTAFEYEVAMVGHYPEERSGNKGAEPEGMEVAEIGGAMHIFLLSERGSVVGVYRDNPGGEPELVQILPSALGPEGAVAIPDRNLLVVANEVDLVEDGGVRSHVTIYQLGEGEAQYPTIRSQMDDEGRPIGFGALSGLAADPDEAGILYAVNDSFYGMQPTIFTIDANQTPAQITAATRITRNGTNAQLLDLEGITPDGEGGFWLASEGRTDRMIPHGLYHVNADGEIEDSVAFPAELLAVERRFGAEGVTMVGDWLWVAIQREWADDEAGQVKLVAYNTDTGEWGAVRYPLEEKGAGWVGLSEIVAHGDHVYIVERDNQIGAAAKLKKIFRVPLSEMEPAPLGGDLPLVSKEEVRDLLPDMAAFGGYALDKVEGLAVDANGDFFAVTDNDGVDDSNGETLFMRLGQLAGS